MDHIPYPDHLGIQPIVVPYIGMYEFDGGDFATFDDRLGLKGQWLSAYQYAAYAQAWLYFGFLEVFLGKNADKKKFLRKTTAADPASTEYAVDSSVLPDLLNDTIKQHRRRIWYQDRVDQELHWRKTLRIAQRWIRSLQEESHWNEVGLNELCASVFVSINILEVTLRDFYFRTQYIWCQKEENWGGYPRAMNTRMPGFMPVLPRKYHREASPGAQLLMNRMKDQGWCAHQAALFLDNVDFVIGYYLSSIPRIEDVTHERCAVGTCIAYNTNNATYVTKHLGGNCACGTVESSDRKLANIIASDGIPLIRIQKRPKGEWALGVVECKPSTEYTAISHVWIDGLGNPKANGLPNCQIEQLADHLIQLRRSQESWLWRPWRFLWRTSDKVPLVWMDTLCIPVKPEHKELREKAINGMSLIYAGAEQVLVLDDELRRIDAKDQPEELLHARMLASKWNSRCWTLQEGALAQKCFFQFRDAARHLVFPEKNYLRSILALSWRALKNPWWFIICICEYISLIRNWSWQLYLRNPVPSGFQTMAQYVQRSFHVLASTRFDFNISFEIMRFSGFNSRSFSGPKGFSSLRHRFERAWNMLGQRTTTYAEDLHVIIANLSGFSVSQIMEIATPVERTKTILQRISGFNVGLMCNSYSRPNAAEDCADRWIPSFPAPDQLDGDVTLVFGERGIEFHDKTEWEDVQALMIPNGAALTSFWIQYAQRCQNKNCQCREEQPKEEEDAEQDAQPQQAENALLSNPEYQQYRAREGFLQEWLEPWQLEVSNGPAPSPTPDPSFPTNSNGEHVVYRWYNVTCQFPENDRLDRSQYEDQEACLLMIPPVFNGPRTRLRGARLLKTGKEETDGKLHLRYDCPLEYSIRYRAPNEDLSRGASLVHVEEEFPCKDILIESGTLSPQRLHAL